MSIVITLAIDHSPSGTDDIHHNSETCAWEVMLMHPAKAFELLKSLRHIRVVSQTIRRIMRSSTPYLSPQVNYTSDFPAPLLVRGGLGMHQVNTIE